MAYDVTVKFGSKHKRGYTYTARKSFPTKADADAEARRAKRDVYHPHVRQKISVKKSKGFW